MCDGDKITPEEQTPVPSCLRCTSTLPAAAQFCPRCGEVRPPRSANDPILGSRPGIPWAGIAFILGVLFAPAAVIAGFYWQSPTIIWTGVVAAAILLLIVVLAHFC